METYGLVVVGVDSVELGKAGEVGAHEDAEIFAVSFAFVLVARCAGLHANPEPIHLDKVANNAVHAGVHIASVLTKDQRTRQRGCTFRRDSQDRGTCPSARG